MEPTKDIKIIERAYKKANDLFWEVALKREINREDQNEIINTLDKICNYLYSIIRRNTEQSEEYKQEIEQMLNRQEEHFQNGTSAIR